MAESNKIELLLEAERRGILPPEKAELLAEARSRGLVPDSEPASTFTKTAEPQAQPKTGVESALEVLWNSTPDPMTMGKQAAIPTALSIGGGIAGGAVAGPPGALAGRAGGSMLGTYLNQKLGLEEESDLAIGAAGGLSLIADTAPGGLRAAGKFLASRLPGAATVLRRFGIDRANALVASMKSDIPSSQLADDLATRDPLIPLEPIRRIAKEIGKSKSLLKDPANKLTTLEADLGILETDIKHATAASGLYPSAKAGAVKGDVTLINTKKDQADLIRKQIADIKAAMAPSLTHDVQEHSARSIVDKLANIKGRYPVENSAGFQEIWDTMKDLNRRIGAAKVNDPNAEFGILMQLKRGMWEALEEASKGTSGAIHKQLKEYNAAYRAEIAADTVEEIVSKNFGRALEGTAEWSSSAAQAHRQLTDATKDKFVKESFKAGELERSLKTFDELRKLPVRGAPAGADAGSKQIRIQEAIGKAAGAGVGAVIGGVAGGLPGAGGGALVGGYIGDTAVILGAATIAKAVQTQEGSKMLLKLMNSPGGFTNAKAATLATFMRAATAETKQAQEAVDAALKTPGPIDSKIQIVSEHDAMKKAAQQIREAVSAY